MSDWFQSYGFAEVFPELIIGAYPLDPRRRRARRQRRADAS